MASVWEVVKTVGAGVISSVVPGGGAVIDVINMFLDDDKKLPATATGQQALDAIESLPPEAQVQVLNKQLDVKLEEIKQPHDSLRAMLTANATSTHTTRPWIAKWSFVFTAIFSGVVGLIVVCAYAYAVYKRDAALVAAVVDGWPFVLAVMGAVTGTFSILLRAYFGLLSKEHDAKVGAATGTFKPNAIASIMGALAKK
ncbi:TMhelix containing protein [Vibrio phage 1.009.O._10N.261.51.C9]|nr:TMhelix containing protein [Vibrio phage 1.009.O._10N.261.51.C9]